MKISERKFSPFYDIFWDELVKAFKGMCKEDANELQQIIRFSITQEKLKSTKLPPKANRKQETAQPQPQQEPDTQYYIHLLILVRAKISETLPNPENLIYEAVHIFRKVELPPDMRKKKLDKRINAIAACAENDILNALLEEKEPPFFSRSWWGQIGLAWCGDLQAEDKTEFRKSFSVELINLKYTGDIVGSKSQHPPTKPFRREFCKMAALALTTAKMRRGMVQQIPGQCDKAPEHCNIRPLHIGWVETNNIPNFSGVAHSAEDCSDYGSSLITQLPKITNDDILYLLDQVPSQVLIPLLSISLFSVIKFHLPNYPSRIDLNKESYLSVLQKQKAIAFYTIHGVQAAELARVFASCFTDYGYGNTLENNFIRNTRVHDGVVILNEPLDNLSEFQRITMLRDACIICTNSQFPKNKNEVSILSGSRLSSEQMVKIGDIVQALVHKFILWFEHTYVKDSICYFRRCAEETFSEFSKVYKEAGKIFCFRESDIRARLVKIQDDMYLDAMITWDDFNECLRVLTSAYEQLLTDADGINPRRIEKSKEHWNDLYYAFLVRNKKRFRNGHKDEFFGITKAKKMLATKDTRYINLCVAMQLFIRFIEEHGIDSQTTQRLTQETYTVFKNLRAENELSVNPVTLMGDYLSHEIESGNIVPVRAQEQRNAVGWYNSRKNQIYLPYDHFFRYVCDFWREANGTRIFRYNKADFLAVLAEREVVIAKKNGKNTSYIRPDTKAVVAPADAEDQESETVVKFDVSVLKLSKLAKDRLKEMSKVKVPLRSKSKKKDSE